jgi:hypothetical protein
MVGYAALFTAVRRRKPWLMLLFGLTGGLAISIKPTFLPLDIALLWLLFVVLRRRHIRALAYLLWALLGLAIVGAIVLQFLLHYGVLKDFIYKTLTVTPMYRGAVGRPLFLASRTIPKYILPLLPIAAVAAIGNWQNGLRWNWERVALALGVLVGLFSYFVQGKGMAYHRYVYLLCLLCLIGFEALAAMRSTRWPRWAGALTIAFTMFFTVPVYTMHMYRIASNSDFTLALEHDLRRLGGSTTLQDKVQCFDLTTGCLNALYHLGIVQNTGRTGDMFFFAKHPSPLLAKNHALYWESERRDPPTVLVISNQYFGEPDGFDKLLFYPRFNQFVKEDFTEVIARSFPMEGVVDAKDALHGKLAPAYRIYIRNNSPLLSSAAALKRSAAP